MQLIKDIKELDLNQGSMVGGGAEESMDMTIEQPQTEIDPQKDSRSEEE